MTDYTILLKVDASKKKIPILDCIRTVDGAKVDSGLFDRVIYALGREPGVPMTDGSYVPRPLDELTSSLKGYFEKGTSEEDTVTYEVVTEFPWEAIDPRSIADIRTELTDLLGIEA